MSGRLLGQEAFGFVDHIGGEVFGEVGDEPLDGAQVIGIEDALVPGVGGGGQLRGQRLAGQRGARCQLGGIPDPPAGFGATDS